MHSDVSARSVVSKFSVCVPLAAYPLGVLFPLGGFVDVVWREDPPRIRPSGLFPSAQKVLQQRWYFSELLVARRRSVDKRLGLPCGAYPTTRGADV